MVADVAVELDYSLIFAVFIHGSANCENSSRWVPLKTSDIHRSINQNGIIILIVFHQLNETALIGNNKSRRSIISVHLRLVVPLDSGQVLIGRKKVLRSDQPLQALHLELVNRHAILVVDSDLSLRRSKNENLAIRTPLNEPEAVFKVLPPLPLSADRPNDDGAVLVDNSDVRAVWAPLHVFDDALVAVVDHLFEPVRLVEHPDNNEPAVVG